jgi:hypothetical protein
MMPVNETKTDKRRSTGLSADLPYRRAAANFHPQPNVAAEVVTRLASEEGLIPHEVIETLADQFIETL